MTLVARFSPIIVFLSQPKRVAFIALALLALLIGLNAWMIYPGNQLRQNALTGSTMGTTWSIKFSNRNSQVSAAVIDYEVKQRLQQINQIMSTYIQASEVSRFNQAAIGQWHDISKELYAIVDQSLQISQKSEGYFDITVGSVVEAYGFGADSSDQPRQSYQVGHGYLQLLPYKLYKSQPVKIDLSAIAKGYAVDQLADILKQYRIQNYLIEIGGEIRVSGENFQGQAWQIAIEKPTPAGREVLLVLPITNQAIASSGSYRNFVLRSDQLLSHTIDPLTSQPIAHQTLATTVIHETAELADAWATAFMAMPKSKALALADELQIAVLLVEGNMFNQDKQKLSASQAMNEILTAAKVSFDELQLSL